MEQFSYERPREKLQRLGADALDIPELIQLIIGTGSVNASGAKLAREVQAIFVNGNVTLESFMEVRGLGAAKASQLVACLELGKRMYER